MKVRDIYERFEKEIMKKDEWNRHQIMRKFRTCVNQALVNHPDLQLEESSPKEGEEANKNE